MQFGYKPNHSTTSCTTVLKEIIKYYLRGNSNVYCCLLDASKALDKIHFGKLFKTLISKNSYYKIDFKQLYSPGNSCVMGYSYV